MGIKLLKFLDNLESHLCKVLLSFFVTLLFLQVIFRVVIMKSLSWSEELSRFAFVWFAFLGASYATRLGAINRVTVQFKFLPKRLKDIILLVADAFWILFNLVMIRESFKVIADMIEFPFNSPALDLPMHYIYMVFPVAFGLMTLRIIQVNILKFFFGLELTDLDDISAELEQMTAESEENRVEVN
jgi:TRAP-type C4-dicarboxylate transport system permease small subunit